MRFEIHDSTNAQFFCRNVASNGQVLCHSETYVRKADAESAAWTVKSGATSAHVVDKTRSRVTQGTQAGRPAVTFEILDSTNGQFYFRIVSSNGRVLFHSEMYVRKAGAESAAWAVKSGAASATVVDLTKSAAARR